MSLNGTVVELAAGDYAATLASSGATLAALTYAGRDLIMPFDPSATIGRGWQGRALAPWPNRIADGRYAFDGVEAQVPRNEHATGAALHGLASWVCWETEATASEVTFALDLPAMIGYEYDVALTATYRLDPEHGLLAVFECVNQGDADAPAGLSAHPYLTAGAPVDDCVFTLVAGQVLETDAAMTPTRLVPTKGHALDFSEPGILGARKVDNAYTELPSRWVVTLVGPEGTGARMTSDAPWVQAFSSDGELGRVAMAVEPMTCGPNAFNDDPESVRLRPGERRVLRFAITAL